MTLAPVMFYSNSSRPIMIYVGEQNNYYDMEMFDVVEIQQYTMQEDCPGPTLDLGIKKGNFIKLRAHNINTY